MLTQEEFLETGLVPVDFKEHAKFAATAEDLSLECPICTLPLEESPIVQTPCQSGKHIFHKECLVHWLTSDSGHSNRCPMCRTVLFSKPLNGEQIIAEAWRVVPASPPQEQYGIIAAPNELHASFHAVADWLGHEHGAIPTDPVVIDLSASAGRLVTAATLLKDRAEVAGRPYSNAVYDEWRSVIGTIWKRLQTLRGRTDRAGNFARDILQASRPNDALSEILP